MSETKVLRVLYTINSSPQYILARSLSPVTVTLHSQGENSKAGSSDTSQPVIYASVSLKLCLETICRSSPELIQDSTRDFSLYVLDPLESNSAPAPVNIANAHGDTGSTGSAQPRGVAVGLGLMSWALAAGGDSIPVTGTLVKQSTGQKALEVIFALRETMAVKQKTWDFPSVPVQPSSSLQESSSTTPSGRTEPRPLQWYSQGIQGSSISYQSSSSSILSRSASTSDLTRETLASIHMRAKAKSKPPKPPRQTNTPVTESDKLMNANTYIGPLKKKGRPKTTTVESKTSTRVQHNAQRADLIPNGKDVIVIDGPDNSRNNASETATVSSAQETSDSLKKKRPSQQPKFPPFTTAPLLRRNDQNLSTISDVQITTKSKELTLLDILNHLSVPSQPGEPHTPNTALLTVLNAIDSAKNPATVLADNTPNLALVDALKQLLALCGKAVPSFPASLPPERISHHRQSSSSSHSDGIIILDKENVNPIVFEKRTVKDFSDKYSDPLPSASASRATQSLRPSTRPNETREASSQSTPVVRKRTLSDFMDEKESGRIKGKERARVEKPSGNHQQMSPVNDTLRHYPSVFAATLPRIDRPSNYYRTPEQSTSPVRGKTDENRHISNVDVSMSRSRKQSSPRNRRVSASSPIRAPKEGRKKYVVPEWARTNTATQPRLSEEAQRALEQAELRRKEEKNAIRRTQVKLKPKDSTDTLKAEPLKPPTEQSGPHFVLPKPLDASQGPIAASSDGPMIAFPLVSSSRSSSPPPNPTSIPQTPKTPSKSRVRSTPGAENESLFTPVMRSGSIFGSALSRHSPYAATPLVLTSPLGNRKKAKISPMRSIFTGRAFTALNSLVNGSSPRTSTDSVHSEEHDGKSPVGKESEQLDDFDCPPGSLPIASSDIDIDCPLSQTSGEDSNHGGDDTEVQPIKQHWTGLPPSSPPAPSSPMLIPEGGLDGDDMDDLPIATSDSEVDADMNTPDIDVTSPNAAGGSLADGTTTETTMNFTEDDFSALFPMENNPTATLQPLSSLTTLDLFEQFTNVNAQSDDSPSSFGESPLADDDFQSTFQNGIDTIDFTEFWETFQPMISESTQSAHPNAAEHNTNSFFDMADNQLPPLFGEIDHVRLADEMQALLSGCLM